MSKTLVVAEPGCTHGGKIEKMMLLIDAAAEAGADVFKSQWMSDPGKVRGRRVSDFKSYDWLLHHREFHRAWAAECAIVGIEYACSTYLPEDVWAVDPFVSRHKISSFENHDMALVLTAIATGKPVMVSLGMTNRETYERLFDLRARHRNLSLLLCTSAYPAPLEQASLRMIEEYGLNGYSDHTRCITAGAGAVHHKAHIVEAHLRLDDTPPDNPDYGAAFTPAEFRQYVQHIRDAEKLVSGPVEWGVREAEQPNVRYKARTRPPEPPANISMKKGYG